MCRRFFDDGVSTSRDFGDQVDLPPPEHGFDGHEFRNDNKRRPFLLHARKYWLDSLAEHCRRMEEDGEHYGDALPHRWQL